MPHFPYGLDHLTNKCGFCHVLVCFVEHHKLIKFWHFMLLRYKNAQHLPTLLTSRSVAAPADILDSDIQTLLAES
jgi:hypothetical protein